MVTLKVYTEQLRKTGETRGEDVSYSCQAIADSVTRQELRITYSARLIDTEVLLTGEIQGTLTFECCRCLESYRQPVSIRFQQAYPATQQEIDVEDEVRQQLILHLPPKPLCKNDCAGLCPGCGRNRNEGSCTCEHRDADPRWEKLNRYIKKDKS